MFEALDFLLIAGTGSHMGTTTWLAPSLPRCFRTRAVIHIQTFKVFGMSGARKSHLLPDRLVQLVVLYRKTSEPPLWLSACDTKSLITTMESSRTTGRYDPKGTERHSHAVNNGSTQSFSAESFTVALCQEVKLVATDASHMMLSQDAGLPFNDKITTMHHGLSGIGIIGSVSLRDQASPA